jgi:hypothetical protein
MKLTKKEKEKIQWALVEMECQSAFDKISTALTVAEAYLCEYAKINPNKVTIKEFNKQIWKFQKDYENKKSIAKLAIDRKLLS